MKHRTIFHRIAWNWKVHGIPRCDAWFSLDDMACRGLIWPWQEVGGNGATAEHMSCMVMSAEQWDNRVMFDKAGVL